MNVYYSIDDLDLSDGPVIVNMNIERANGQQIVSSPAPDAVVEEFDLQGLVDSAEDVESLCAQRDKLSLECDKLKAKLEEAENSYRDRVANLVTDLEWFKRSNWQLRAELKECERVSDNNYRNLKIAREDGKSLREQRDHWSLECDKLYAKLEEAENSHEAACRERDELKELLRPLFQIAEVRLYLRKSGLSEVNSKEYKRPDDGADAFADELRAAKEEFAKDVAKIKADLK